MQLQNVALELSVWNKYFEITIVRRASSPRIKNPCSFPAFDSWDHKIRIWDRIARKTPKRRFSDITFEFRIRFCYSRGNIFITELLRSLGKCCTVLARVHGYRKKNTYTNKKIQWSWMYFKGIVAWDGFGPILSLFLSYLNRKCSTVTLFCTVQQWLSIPELMHSIKWKENVALITLARCQVTFWKTEKKKKYFEVSMKQDGSVIKFYICLAQTGQNKVTWCSARTGTRIGLLEEIPRSGVQIPCLT